MLTMEPDTMKRTTTLAAVATLATLFTLNAGGCGGVVDSQAEKQFQADAGRITVTIFPAYLRDGRAGGYDDAAATTIADALRERNLATVTVSAVHIPFSGRPNFNQAKMLRETLAEFAEYVRTHPIETDYALIPEYLIMGNGHVGGVHALLVDKQGTCAYALGLNSHHEPFQRVDPKSPEDGTRIVLDVMLPEWPRP